MNPILARIWAALALASIHLGAQAQITTVDRAGLVVIESAHPVAETERRLIQAIEAAGLKVAARIDHEANAKSVSMQLAPTVLLLFGNPRAGTILMEQPSVLIRR